MSTLTNVIGKSGFAYPGTVTVTRTPVGTTDGYGTYSGGTASTFTLSPVGVVPGGSGLKTSEMMGYSADDVRTLYTTVQLLKVPFPDRVTIDGENFAVFHVDGPWTGFGGTHYVVRVARITAPGIS